ncbi:hypothetical protein IFR05_002355 [Cadophora sp. M221]|nr:hypothetical protein IFR05_002355 [Cadophora sp. M221]
MTHISSAIFSAIQHDWISNATHCYTPPSNLNIPIMCNIASLFNDDDGYLRYFEYMSCCPPNANGTNIWEVRRGCSPTCYNHDTTLAEGMNDCVKKIAEPLGNANGSNVTWASCEYIDYEAIKKGKLSSVGAKHGAGSLVLGTGLVTIGVMVLSSM